MKSKNALIIPDTHIPYHDKRAYELMLKVARQQPIHEIVILGDYADFYGINSHGQDPAINLRLSDEVEAVKRELRRLRKFFPKSNIVFIQGNHEYRLERYIQNKAPELFNVLSTYEILGLGDLDIKYIPYGPNQKYKVLGTKLIARHEPIAGGTHVAHGTVVKAGSSVIFGHVHRIQESQVVMINGDNHRGITCGWLGDSNSRVMQYVKNHHQWALGFAIVNGIDKGRFFVDTKHIIDYMVYHNGKIVKG